MPYKIVGADMIEYGPVEMVTLRQWTTEGRVQPSTIVIDMESGMKFQAIDMPELKPLLPYQPINPSAPPGYPGSPVPMGYPGQPPFATPLKSKMVAGLLGIFLGGFGAQRFYLGYTTIGIIQLVVSFITCGVGGIWGFVEGIMCLTGNMTDSEGRPLGD